MGASRRPMEKQSDWYIDAHSHIFSIIFRLFDQKWNQMMVGYLGFQQVIDKCRDNIDELLQRRSVMDIPGMP